MARTAFTLDLFAPFLEERHIAQIEAVAARYQLKLRYNPEDVSDAEVIFGAAPNSVLCSAPALKWFASSWAGLDGVLNGSPKLPESVTITSSSGCYGVTISEAIVMMILMVFRREPEHFRLTEERIWKPLDDMRTIQGSSVTVIGCGNIGRCTARRLKALGASRVRGVRRRKAEPDEDFDEMYQSDELEQAVADTDLVILCLPGTDETKSVISRKLIEKMAPQTVIVNIGRGSAIDQDALVEALNEGRLAGAALDVTSPEPLPADHPLWSAKNILITPHISGRTAASVTRDLIVDKFLRNLTAYCEEQPLESIIDRQKGY